MRLKDKLVLITGASSGIGRACAELFAAEGANLLLCARRHSALVALQQELTARHPISIDLLTLDIRHFPDVEKAWQLLPVHLKQIDILVNNAGLAMGVDSVAEGDSEHWDLMIDTNVKGLLYITRAVLPSMLARNQGHVINIGSIAGYENYPGGSVYCATKFAVRGLSDGIKIDVHGSQIRVTEIDPGMVETDFSTVRFQGDIERAKRVYANTVPLTPHDVADAVVYCATRPAHVDVRTLRIMPTDQSTITMVRRDEK